MGSSHRTDAEPLSGFRKVVQQPFRPLRQISHSPPGLNMALASILATMAEAASDISAIQAMCFGKLQPQVKILRSLRTFCLQNLNTQREEF